MHGTQLDVPELHPGRRLGSLLITDIVNSTARLVELGDEKWRFTLKVHDEASREQFLRLNGHEIEKTGDGFISVFYSPADAIICARAIHSRVKILRLEIRAGLHVAELRWTANGIEGRAIHFTTRVAEKARAGEIMASSTVRDSLAGSDFKFEDRGLHKLKGFPGKHRLFTVQP
jgi:class 3 adenylate cyclase